MSLEFDGVTYRTISDVKDEFRVAEKTIKKMIKNGAVPSPPEVQRGARRFKHYTDEWCEELRKALMV